MILQTTLPVVPWMDPKLARLPGTIGIGADEWLCRDEAYAGQMGEADRLLAAIPDKVCALDGVDAESEELCAAVLALVAAWDGFEVASDSVLRPDGVVVPRDQHPLVLARRLVQEDLLIHQTSGDHHALKGGILCFPASWALSEKMNRSLKRIHAPVEVYDHDLNARVERMFSGLHAGRPIMRANWLTYARADLYHPHSETARRPRDAVNFMRVERQCLLRLPVTLAVVFTIHTFVVPISALSAQERAGLPKGTFDEHH